MNVPSAARDSMGVNTTPQGDIRMMNRFRTLVVTAASAANADVCWDLPTDGTTSYYYF